MFMYLIQKAGKRLFVGSQRQGALKDTVAELQNMTNVDWDYVLKLYKHSTKLTNSLGMQLCLVARKKLDQNIRFHKTKVSGRTV